MSAAMLGFAVVGGRFIHYRDIAVRQHSAGL